MDYPPPYLAPGVVSSNKDIWASGLINSSNVKKKFLHLHSPKSNWKSCISAIEASMQGL